MLDNNPSKPNPLTPTITTITQISTTLSLYQQQHLQKLDNAVLKYISNRNTQKLPPSSTSSIDSTSMIDHLSLEGLQAIHKESQASVLGLEREIDQFNKLKLMLYQSNVRAMSDMTEGSDGVQIIQLCKRLIKELSKYKDVDQFCTKLVELRKKNIGLNSEKLMADINAYIKKVQDIFSDDEEQTQRQRSRDQSDSNDGDNSADQRNQKFRRIGKNGRVALLLDFIE